MEGFDEVLGKGGEEDEFTGGDGSENFDAISESDSSDIIESNESLPCCPIWLSLLPIYRTWPLSGLLIHIAHFISAFLHRSIWRNKAYSHGSTFEAEDIYQLDSLKGLFVRSLIIAN